MIRWLLLIPFALLIALGASGTFFLLATMIDPVMATLTGDTLFVGFWAFIDAVFTSDTPGLVVEDALLAIGRLAFTLLVLPPLVIAAFSEIIGLRSLAWYMGATGVLTAAVPWIMRGEARIASPEELHVSFVLGLTGAVAGFVYWAIAGRDAGERPAATEPSSGS